MNDKKRLSSHVTLLCGCLAAAGAAAQTAPRAGDLLRQLEPPPATAPRPDAPRLEGTTPPAATPAPASVTKFQLLSLRITGATRFTEDQLVALVRDAIGREMDLAQLQALADRITLHYRRHGYTVARAYLPPQQVQDGGVQIAVLEGKLDQIVVNNPGLVPPSSLPLGGLSQGDVVADAPLERALLLMSDLPGVDARATLQPGASVGTSRVVFDMTPTPLVTGSAELDNWGGESTGRVRAGGRLQLNNPLKLGDQLSLHALASEHSGLRYGRAAYQLPVGARGTQVGGSLLALDYKLGGAFAALQAHGTAKAVGAFVSHPLVRSRRLNVNAQLSAEDKQLRDRIDATAFSSEKDLRLVSLGVSGDWHDSVGGDSISLFSANWTRGRLGMDAASAAIDAVSAQTAGNFDKFGVTLRRLQALGASTNLYASLQAQWASKNLDASEKMPLGGALAVRAYAQGDAASDEAQLLTLELRHSIAQGWQVVGFYDWAHGRVNQSPWAVGDNRRTLQGAGMGLTWNSGAGHALRVYWAHRIGNAPAGTRPDGGRLWVQGIIAF